MEGTARGPSAGSAVSTSVKSVHPLVPRRARRCTRGHEEPWQAGVGLGYLGYGEPRWRDLLIGMMGVTADVDPLLIPA